MSQGNAQASWDRLGALDPAVFVGEQKKLYDDIVTFFDTP